jgi:hypothetical protein
MQFLTFGYFHQKIPLGPLIRTLYSDLKLIHHIIRRAERIVFVKLESIINFVLVGLESSTEKVFLSSVSLKAV